MSAIAKPEVIQMATEREAAATTYAVRMRFKGMQAAWWEFGQMIRDALDRQVPSVLEMSVMDWLKSCVGESVAKVYRSLRIVKALDGVPEEQVKLLSEGNAYQLTRLPEAQRKSQEWVNQALVLGNADFESEVDGFIEKKTGMKTEPRVQIKVTLDEGTAKVWGDAEAKIAAVLELDILTRPGLRAQVFEALATLVITTDAEVLRAEMVGSVGEAEEA